MSRKLELWDAHFSKKHPTEYERFADKAADAIEGFATLFSSERYRQVEAEHYRQFDQSVVKELGFSVEDLLELRREKIRRRQSAGNRPTNEKKKEDFLAIVIQCEREGMTFAQTLRELCKELSLTERALRGWLEDLIESPHCDIPPPRPKGNG